MMISIFLDILSYSHIRNPDISVTYEVYRIFIVNIIIIRISCIIIKI